MKQRYIAWALVAGAGWVLAACAWVNDKAMGAFSSSVAATAIVNEQLLQGEVRLLPDRTGTVTLESAAKTPLSNCAGRLRYSGTTSGVMDLNCNNGTAVSMRVAFIGETRGYAYGQTANGPASLTFGLAPQDAKAYLVVPANQQWVVGAEALALEPK